MEPLQALSRFTYLCVIFAGPVAWVLVVIFKRRWGRGYDGVVEASSEEILEELRREFTPLRRTTIRTQTEYLHPREHRLRIRGSADVFAAGAD
jgi:hypothetical protein